MADPEIHAKEPAAVELEPGTYYWCACGRSKKQPFCDGSHQGTEFSPVELSVSEKKTYYLCQCKRTGNPPHCDGTHNKLD